MEISFKASQSFALREGWVQKALIEINQHPEINVFSKKDGVVFLGVGSNMVTSIKYWLDASGIIKPNSKKGIELSSFGKLINSYDPFLESNVTRQLIHLNLVLNQKSTPLFWALFNLFNVEESFTKESFSDEIINYYLDEGITVNPQYVDDDFSVLVRSYISTNKSDPEDNMDCPLSSLGLLKQTARGQFKKTPISLNLIEPRIVLYLTHQIAGNKQTIAFDDLISFNNSPAKIFNLDRNSMMTIMLTLSNLGYIDVVKTAGLNTINLRKKKYTLTNLFEDCFGGSK